MKNTLIQEGFVLFKWIKIDSIFVIISAVIVVRRSGVVISSKEINLMFGYTLKTLFVLGGLILKQVAGEKLPF